MDVLDTVEDAIPEPKSGHVRVKGLAAGAGCADIMAQHGGYPLAPKLPFTPGYDLVGIVDHVSSDAIGIETGSMWLRSIQSLVVTRSMYVCLQSFYCLFLKNWSQQKLSV